MKKVKNKILLIIVVVFSILIILPNCSYCDLVTDMDYRDEVVDSNKLTEGISVVYRLIQYAGTGISLAMVMILGIKYMLSSVEEKAEIKKQAVPIVVGSAFIFAASQLVAIVGKFMEN